jgi:hypothetical protein
LFNSAVEEAFFQQVNTEGALELLFDKTTEQLRRRTYHLMSQALDQLSGTNTVWRSWDRAGILRALFSLPPKESLPVDEQLESRTFDFFECGADWFRVCDRCGETLCATCLEEHHVWCFREEKKHRNEVTFIDLVE